MNEEAEGVQIPDYDSFPTYDMVPTVGHVVAYKILEISGGGPEMSDWKEAQILNYDENSRMVQVQVLYEKKPPKTEEQYTEQEEEIEEENDGVVDVIWDQMQDVKFVRFS